EREAQPRGDVGNRGAERGRARSKGVAVQVAVLVWRRPGPVLVDQRVAAGRLADGAVVQGLRAGDDARGDRRGDEPRPAGDREPGPARAPASDRGDGPHPQAVYRPGAGAATPEGASSEGTLRYVSLW